VLILLAGTSIENTDPEAMAGETVPASIMVSDVLYAIGTICPAPGPAVILNHFPTRSSVVHPAPVIINVLVDPPVAVPELGPVVGVNTDLTPLTTILRVEPTATKPG
jgi:hypothetical protein